MTDVRRRERVPTTSETPPTSPTSTGTQATTTTVPRGVEMIASLLTPWGQVAPSKPTTRVAVGDEPDIRESFEARVDTNIDFEWPREIEACANVAGLELPAPSSARGATIEWTTYEFPPLATAQIPDIGTVTSSDEFVGSSTTGDFRLILTPAG